MQSKYNHSIGGLLTKKPKILTLHYNTDINYLHQDIFMTNIGQQLKVELGYSPLFDSILLQFDKEILLATAQILPLPLKDIF